LLIVTTNTLAEIETKREKIKRCVIPGTGVWKVRRRGFFSLRIIASMLLLPNAASTHCCCYLVLSSLGVAILSYAVVARCWCPVTMLLSLGAAVALQSHVLLFFTRSHAPFSLKWPLEPTPAPSSSLLATRMHRSVIWIEINDLHMKLSAKPTYA
jgi:hypothetical protein